MTFAEVGRAMDSKRRVIEFEDKRRANLVYTLADLIGYSVGRIHNSNNTMPSIEEAFPYLFNTKEEQERKEALKVAKFKAQLLQFTNSHNDKMRGLSK